MGPDRTDGLGEAGEERFRSDIREMAARLAEDPTAWEQVRENTRRSFNRIAPEWDSHVGPHHVALLDAALQEIPRPRVALDLGTGTGVGAEAIARHFDDAIVIGADLAEEMVRGASAKPFAHSVRFVVGDAARLPFADGAFDLIIALNMFGFFAEVTRVLSAAGTLAILYSRAEETPIFVPTVDLHRHLRTAGFTAIVERRAAKGSFHLARR